MNALCPVMTEEPALSPSEDSNTPVVVQYDVRPYHVIVNKAQFFPVLPWSKKNVALHVRYIGLPYCVQVPRYIGGGKRRLFVNSRKAPEDALTLPLQILFLEL
jgi:hypothetical protein